MKRFISIFAILLTLATTTQAQRIHAFVTAGVQSSQIEGDELKGFKHFGFTGGVGALVALSERGPWGLSIEALFSQRGTSASLSTANAYMAEIPLNYVDIPLLIHYQDFYGGMLFGVGVQYGRLVRQPHGELRFSRTGTIPDTTDMTFIRDDVEAVVDARFTLWRGLQLNLRWQHSLFPIKRDWQFQEYVQGHYKEHANNCYNHAVSIRLIYQF